MGKKPIGDAEKAAYRETDTNFQKRGRDGKVNIHTRLECNINLPFLHLWTGQRIIMCACCHNKKLKLWNHCCTVYAAIPFTHTIYMRADVPRYYTTEVAVTAPDQPFHYIRASRSGHLRVLCTSSERRASDFEAPKL